MLPSFYALGGVVGFCLRSRARVCHRRTFHRLRFDFMRSDGYGPIHYELEREPDCLR
jgi:hypothetical protein